MSAKPIRTLSDAVRHGGGFIAVRCRCHHRAKFDTRALEYYYIARGLAREWRDFPAYLRCSKCGSRWPEVGWILAGEPSEHYPLVEVPAPAPKGVSQRAWNRCDERTRKRLVRQARD